MLRGVRAVQLEHPDEMLIRLGLDRELRGRSAGIRTHGLVGLSAAATTLSAVMLYAEVRASAGRKFPGRDKACKD